MDLLHETAPFLVGMIVPPLVMLFIRTTWSSQLKFTIAFLPALILGFCISALAGELAGGIPDGLIAVIIDTSLVFTGSQLAYRLFWKPILEARLQSVSTTRMQRIRE
jgi:FtsH-binding integral membrane protein